MCCSSGQDEIIHRHLLVGIIVVHHRWVCKLRIVLILHMLIMSCNDGRYILGSMCVMAVEAVILDRVADSILEVLIG